MVNRDAPYSGLSSLMAMQGRYGDTELVHMSKPEIQGLASLGQLTINPETGLPEAFNMKSLLPVIGGIAGSIILPGLGTALGSGLGATAIGSGLGTAAGGLLAGQKPGEALLGGVTSGLLSFGIGSILGGATPGLTETAAESAGLAALDASDEALGAALAESFPSSPDVLSANFLNSATNAPTISASLPASPAVDLASVSSEGLLKPTFSLEKAYEPSALGKLMGKEAIPAGPVTKEQFIQLGGIPSDATFKDIALQKAKQPLTYAPLGIAALTGGFDEPYKEPEPEERQPAKFPEYKFVGGKRQYPTETAEEIMKRLQQGGVRPPSFSPYEYNFLGTRTAAEGGIVGLQQGGMATPQAPSAMASMLAQPQPQQSIPINVQVQPQQSVMPQQPQPSMSMSQTGSGVEPLPDQQKEFIKLMDMEEKLQSQKSSQSTQDLANIMGLGMNFASNQYPQTSPSGQAVQPPSPPPMNYGSQVNLGLAGGGQPYFEGQVQGPGDGQSDEVAFRVDGGQVDGAMLSPDEYVLAADVVSAIGNGSSDAGAEKLDQFMKSVRQDAYGTTKQMQPFNNQGLTNLVA